MGKYTTCSHFSIVPRPWNWLSPRPVLQCDCQGLPSLVSRIYQISCAKMNADEMLKMKQKLSDTCIGPCESSAVTRLLIIEVWWSPTCDPARQGQGKMKCSVHSVSCIPHTDIRQTLVMITGMGERYLEDQMTKEGLKYRKYDSVIEPLTLSSGFNPQHHH